ncbi:MAG: Na+/H+ antiporter NhaA [Bacteroidia bacterium]|nr:Na+/H+ antiporter NhaA [Bacteroidia bacterium]
MSELQNSSLIEAIKPIFRFIKKEINSGIVLIAVSILAMIVANSQWAKGYFELFEDTYISIDFHLWSLKKPLHYWINDGLMAIFFFMIGLEVKREVMIGELSSFKKALFPMVGAIGGMLVPALIFFLININNPTYINGWAIPMATDIAFALGILALLRSQAPPELKVFLTSLAIVDDIGAVLTIAVFYTDDISLTYLLLAFGSWAFLLLLNTLRVRITWLYILIGILAVWYPLLLSGVHATVAGVMVALAIPLRRAAHRDEFISNVGAALNNFKNNSEGESIYTLNSNQYDAVEDIKEYSRKVSSPLQSMEHNIHEFTLYFIMPVFAFANTGIQLSTIELGELASNPLSQGIFLGLVAGKVIGILGFVFIFQKLKIINIPESLSWRHLLGGSFLAGIGFTMSIFISELAFHGDDLIPISKVSILCASIVAGVVGYLILKTAPSKVP